MDKYDSIYSIHRLHSDLHEHILNPFTYFHSAANTSSISRTTKARFKFISIIYKVTITAFSEGSNVT